MVGVVEPLLLVVEFDDVTPVTKKSSVPTFRTAFWLLIVAIRGLDNTCTLPCVSRKLSSEAKFAVCRANPKSPCPSDEAMTEPARPGVIVASPDEILPVVVSVVPGLTEPMA